MSNIYVFGVLEGEEKYGGDEKVVKEIMTQLPNLQIHEPTDSRTYRFKKLRNLEQETKINAGQKPS